MNDLNWTTDKPIEPGWYWYRRSGSSEALLVHHGFAWDQIVELPGVDEPVTFMTEKLTMANGPDRLSRRPNHHRR